MAKDTFWFKHDYNARNDEKVLELRSIHGAEAYGIYWMIVETMADNDNGGVKASFVGGLSHGYGVAKARLLEVIKCCVETELFFEKEGYIFSNRMLRHKEERKFFSDMGKEGAEKKKEYRGAKGGLNRGEERRGEKSRLKGEKFSENNEEVIFANGKSQKLGEQQKERLIAGDLKPYFVIEGAIY